MSTYRKLMTVGCAAVLALGLAACGNGDDTAEAPTTMEPMEAMEPTAEEQLAALREEISALRAQLGIEDDDDLGDSVADLQSEVASLKMQIQDAEDAEAEAEAERVAAEKAVAGKALQAAINRVAFDDVTVGAGPVITNANGTGTAITTATLRKGDSAGSLGDWAGTHYSHMNAGAKTLDEAVIYTNKAAAERKPFATHATQLDDSALGANYVASTNTLDLGTNPNSSTDIKGDGFPTAGTTTFTPDGVSGVVVVPGTYQGASGSYRCAGTDCSATAGANGAVDLAGTNNWFFVHDANAMVSIGDSNYLQFGWWLRKLDGSPNMAGTFHAITGAGETLADIDAATYVGTATYAGKAAGKFAINSPLGGSDAGHFTADVTLSAKFGNAGDAGITGTVSDFMANEQSVPWSVALGRAAWDTATEGAFASVADDAGTADVDESTATVWSIDGNAAAAAGGWQGQVYDMDGDDGSNVPTHATGIWNSEFGSTHSMVGAFGAEQQ